MVKALMFEKGKGAIGIFRPPIVAERYDLLQKIRCRFIIHHVQNRLRLSCKFQGKKIAEIWCEEEGVKTAVDDLIETSFLYLQPVRRN